MKIIKYKKKDSDKYKLYLEDGSTIDIYEDVIIKNNLLYKKELTNELFNTINQDNNYQKIYNSCIKYISLRIRSTKEIEEYLTRKNISDEIKETIITKLKERKIIDDERFTECYIKDKINLTNWGEYKIINNLRILGISNNIIDKYSYLFEKDIQKEKIDKIINKIIRTNRKENSNLRNKAYNNLVSLGYSEELIISSLNNNF